MNDYWNDPPERPDPPQCPRWEDADSCDGCGEYLYDSKSGMVFSCDVCGYQWVEPFSPPPNEELSEEELKELRDIHVQCKMLCPHGREWHECDDCARASDFAYDVWRESRR